MKKFYFSQTVDDVALDTWSTPENLEDLIHFFSEEGIPATFFVVPIDEVTDKPFTTLSDKYVPLIKAAYSDGFRVGQHGLRHNRFELGIPPMMVLDLPHEAENKKWVEDNRDFLEKDHSLENCRARLKQGREILEDAFGFPIIGFRAPALQESPGMFAALKKEGYLFDSSAVLQETGWDYLLDKLDVPPRDITRAKWEALRAKGQGLTIPHTCDYTWFLSKNYDAMMSLAKHDLQQSIEADIPFVNLCHVNPVHEGEGMRFMKEFFAVARKMVADADRELVFDTLENIAKIL